MGAWVAHAMSDMRFAIAEMANAPSAVAVEGRRDCDATREIYDATDSMCPDDGVRVALMRQIYRRMTERMPPPWRSQQRAQAGCPGGVVRDNVEVSTGCARRWQNGEIVRGGVVELCRIPADARLCWGETLCCFAPKIALSLVS